LHTFHLRLQDENQSRGHGERCGCELSICLRKMITTKRYFQFKNGEDRQMIELLTPYLLMTLGYVALYCENHHLPFRVTRTVDEMIQGVSKTDIHADGRAFDISVQGWTTDDIDNFVHDMNTSDFAHRYGAISTTDNQVRLIVWEPSDDSCGKIQHLHAQVRRKE